MFKDTIDSLISYLSKFNVYIATNEDTVEERQKQIIATRIFLILLIVSLIGLVAYTSFSLQSITIHLKNPSQSTFEKLQSKHPDTLACPCSQTSVQVNKFVRINVSYHQICSSMFVNDEWMLSTSYLTPQLFYLLDIRRMISSQLQLLASLCHSSEKAVSDALEILESDQLFTPNMVSRKALETQMDIIISEAIKDATAEQNQSRILIQSINQQNQVVSSLGTSYLYQINNSTTELLYPIQFLKNWRYPPSLNISKYGHNQLCSCLDSSNCTYPAGIYPNLTAQDSYTYQGVMVPTMISLVQIPGFYVGCTPLDAIIQSTLECFYDDLCLSQLFNTTSIKQLDSILESQYDIHNKVKILIENLFIEQWSKAIDFQSYFQECQPNICSYTYNTRGNAAFIVTTILALVGGLFVSLKIIAPFIVTLYETIATKVVKWFSSSNEVVDDSSVPNEGMRSWKEWFGIIHQRIVNFNLFKEAYNDDHGRRNEILTTRIYVLLMIIAVIIIVFYALITEHTVTYYIKPPSLLSYRQLVSQYSTLTCECEQITATYSIFISFSPKSHQLCSSLFVSDLVRPETADIRTGFILGRFNFRLAMPSFYAAGRMVCILSKDVYSQAIDAYLETIYVSHYLTFEEEFLSRMQASVNNFKAIAPAAFYDLLQLIRYSTQGNQLLTGSFTNAKIQHNILSTNTTNAISILWTNIMDPSCNCGLSLDSCPIPFNQYCNFTYNIQKDEICSEPVPGLIISCYIIDGLLSSSGQCLYNQKCIMPSIRKIAMALNLPVAVVVQMAVALDKNAPSRFPPNATASEILRFFGIEDWNETIDYASYYHNCNPINCFYTITKNFHIPTVVTTVIGLIGGISVILRILVPLIIKLIRYRSRINKNNSRVAWQVLWSDRLMRKLRELNLFETAETSQSHDIRQDQTLSTRLYLILWIISVTFLTIYLSLSTRTDINIVESPSLTTVKEIQSQNHNEFLCPCSKITISFQTFTTMNFIFHQICSSDLISNRWLEGLFNFSDGQSFPRAFLSSHFQFLRLFCLSSNETLISSRRNFYANQFISINLLREEEFHNQSEALTIKYQQQTINSFSRNLDLIVQITLGNQLISVYESNWYLLADSHQYSPVYTQSRSYGNCSCASAESSECIDQLLINGNVSVPEMFIGCLPITSLRLSTLQCFYDQTCLDSVKYALGLENLTISALNSTQPSQFSMNTAVDRIFDNLMLEEWTNSRNYSAYFHECNPQQCTYSITKRNDLLLIFTTLLGLYGGLIVALKLVAPTLVKIIRKVHQQCRRNRRTVPQSF